MSPAPELGGVVNLGSWMASVDAGPTVEPIREEDVGAVCRMAVLPAVQPRDETRHVQ
jgi:hypothetical protein